MKGRLFLMLGNYYLFLSHTSYPTVRGTLGKKDWAACRQWLLLLLHLIKRCVHDGDKRRWSSVHKGKSSLDKPPGRRTELTLWQPSPHAFPEENPEQPKMLRVYSYFSSLFLSQETLQKSPSTRMQHNILTVACCQTVWRDRPPRTYCETTGGNFW